MVSHIIILLWTGDKQGITAVAAMGNYVFVVVSNGAIEPCNRTHCKIVSDWIEYWTKNSSQPGFHLNRETINSWVADITSCSRYRALSDQNMRCEQRKEI